MSFPADFVHNFTAEIWSLYGVGSAILIIRLVDRARRRSSLSEWLPDDWVALQLVFWYTLLTISFYKIVNGGGSNFMTPEEEATLTPEITAMRVTGSKWVVVSEQAMIFTIWSCKVIMLLVYRRLTSGLKQERFIKAVAVWVAIGFVGVQVALFASCRPFSAYWSVPATSTQCWSYYNYSYVFAVFNITADVATLIVGMPLLFSVQCPWQQKLPVIVVFGMGLFVIAAAIANKLYALVPALLSYDYALWYNREAAVCVYVTNLPVIYTLLRETFPSMQRWGQSSGHTGGQQYGSQRPGRSDMRSTRKGETVDIEVGEVSSELGGIRQTHQIIVEEQGIPGLSEKLAAAAQTNGGIHDANGGKNSTFISSEKI
ncbi:Hypothetical protein D9617_23g006430 [Elsinoe fawcettii]|nr:Hypothetical protein D9617_23g006430 [Elsinoe fawcettii]